jgi:hypothetical protein
MSQPAQTKEAKLQDSHELSGALRQKLQGYVNSTLPFGPVFLWDSVCGTCDVENPGRQ